MVDKDNTMRQHRPSRSLCPRVRDAAAKPRPRETVTTVTILLRLEKPNMQITVCGMVSQQWLDGLLSGAIAQAQGGLTQGQLMWRELHRRQAETGSPAAQETPPPHRSTRTRRPQRRRQPGPPTASPTPDQFDLVDTEEL